MKKFCSFMQRTCLSSNSQHNHNITAVRMFEEDDEVEGVVHEQQPHRGRWCRLCSLIARVPQPHHQGSLYASNYPCGCFNMIFIIQIEVASNMISAKGADAICEKVCFLLSFFSSCRQTDKNVGIFYFSFK